MSAGIHVGDIGTRFIVTVRDGTSTVDMSAATVKQLIFVKPNKEKLTKSPTFVTDGTDGELQYITVEGDLDRAGTWQLQVYLSMPTWTGHSGIDDFIVWDNL